VNTFSRGRTSSAGMPFATNPARMAGQFPSDWPETARDRASCWICSFVARSTDLSPLGVKKEWDGTGNGPTDVAGPGSLGEHLPRLNGLQGRAEVIAVGLE
jgi:hypothetical protein